MRKPRSIGSIPDELFAGYDAATREDAVPAQDGKGTFRIPDELFAGDDAEPPDLGVLESTRMKAQQATGEEYPDTFWWNARAVSESVLPFTAKLRNIRSRSEMNALDELRNFGFSDETTEAGAGGRSFSVAPSKKYSCVMPDLKSDAERKLDNVASRAGFTDDDFKYADDFAKGDLAKKAELFKMLAENEMQIRLQAQRRAGNVLSTSRQGAWNAIGSGVVDNAGYQLEFMTGTALTGGGALLAGAGRTVFGQGAKHAAKEIGKRLGRGAAAGSVPAAASMAERYSELSSKDFEIDGDDGGIVVINNADVNASSKSVLGATAEVAVEIGTDAVVSALLRGAGRVALKVPGAKTVSDAATKAGRKVVEALDGSAGGRVVLDAANAYKKFSRITHFHGIGIEMLEEHIQDVFDDVAGLGKKDAEHKGAEKEWEEFKGNFLSYERNREIFLGLVGTMAIQGGFAARHGYRHDSKDKAHYTGFLKDAGLSEKTVSGMSLKEQEYLYRIFSNPGVTPERVQRTLRRFGTRLQEAAAEFEDIEGFYFTAGAEGVKTKFSIPHRTGADGKKVPDLVRDKNDDSTALDKGTGIGIGRAADMRPFVVTREGKRIYMESLVAARDLADKLSVGDQMRDIERGHKAEYLNGLVTRLAGKENYEAYNTMGELVSAHPEIEKADGFNPLSPGVRLEDGTVAVVLDNNTSAAGMMRTVIHESGVHSGLRNIFGTQEKLNHFLKNVVGIEGVDEIGTIGVEEALAAIYECKHSDPTLYQRAVHGMRDMLRKVSPDMKFSPSDIEVIMAAARDSVDGEGGSVVRMPLPNTDVVDEGQKDTAATPKRKAADGGAVPPAKEDDTKKDGNPIPEPESPPNEEATQAVPDEHGQEEHPATIPEKGADDNIVPQEENGTAEEAQKPTPPPKRKDAAKKTAVKKEREAAVEATDTRQAQAETEPPAQRVEVKSPLDNLSEDDQARAKALQDKLRKLRGRLNVGVDPEVLTVGTELTGLYIKGGVRTFRQYAENVKRDMADLWDGIKKHLRTLWESAAVEHSEIEEVTRKEAQDIINALDSAGEKAQIGGEGETGKEANHGRRQRDGVGGQGVQRDEGRPELRDAPRRGDDRAHGGLLEGVPAEDVGGTGGGAEGAGQEAGGRAVQPGEGRAGDADEVGRPDRERGGAHGEREADTGAGERGDRRGRGTGADDSGAPGHIPAPTDKGRTVVAVPADEGHAAGGDSAEDRASPRRKRLGGGDGGARADFHISDISILSGDTQAARFGKNKRAIGVYNELRDTGRTPTQEDLDALAAYVGWGAFGQELFQGNWECPMPQKGWEERGGWLRENLGEEEWNSARESIVNAHYTDPLTVRVIWDAVRKLGFNGGRVLEPSAGIGNFYGLMPQDMAANSSRSAVEMDRLAAGMFAKLYPNVNLAIQPYQDNLAPDNFYDLVISNFPFLNVVQKSDPRYAHLSPMLHDYFFLKALDQVRPGGLVVGITSAGTMDKAGEAVRAKLAQEAELVAAFRLPSGAFKGYAGTSVVTDLIILKKRDAPKLNIRDECWVKTADVAVPDRTNKYNSRNMKGNVRVNRYYQENPTHILGTLVHGHGTTLMRAGMTVERTDDFQERLNGIPAMLPSGAYTPKAAGQERYTANSENTGERFNTVIGKDGKLFQVKGQHLMEIPAQSLKKGKDRNAAEAVAELSGIGRLRGEVIRGQLSGDSEAAETARKRLKSAYYDFVARHGTLHGSQAITNLEALGDPNVGRILSLEVNDGVAKNGKARYKPVEILDRPTMRSAPRIENPTVSDAYMLQRNESIELDTGRIAELSGKSEQEVVRELSGNGAIFKTPYNTYEHRDALLGGNVRQKLREAATAKENGMEGLDKTIELLTQELPDNTPFYDISVKIGAPWITPGDYRAFMASLLNVPESEEGITVAETPGGWKVDAGRFSNKPEYHSVWGTPEAGFSKTMAAAMNNTDIIVRHLDENQNPCVDEQATEAAMVKVEAVRTEFVNWIWKDEGRRARLESQYNERVNYAAKTSSFDGGHLACPGLALKRGDAPFNLRKHQVNAAYRGLMTGKGLFAHEVGTGKTYTMGLLAIEGKRLGRFRKPMILAHNANSVDVYSSIQAMYPGANVLYVDNLSKESRQEMLERIATQDWDAVVVPHPVMPKLQLKQETLQSLAEEELRELEDAAMEAALKDGVEVTVEDMDDALGDSEAGAKKLYGKLRRSPTAKELVKQRNRILQDILQAAQESSEDGAVFFEDLGIDAVIVDEAHIFKKLPVATRQRVKGLNTAASQAGNRLNFITEYVKRLNGGKNIFLFTGTPITNTITEIYNMSRYIMSGEMKQLNIKRWDNWFNTFAAVKSETELQPTGAYESVNRLNAFVNVPELRRIIGQNMDVVFADDMPEFAPRKTASGKVLGDKSLTFEERDFLENGRTENAVGRPYKRVITDVAKMTPEQAEIKRELDRRINEFKRASPKAKREMILEGSPNVPIRVEGDANKMSVDARLYNKDLNDHADSKMARCAGNVLRHYRDGGETAVQVIFTESGRSDKAKRSAGKDGAGKKQYETVETYNFVTGLIDELVKGGIPRSLIETVDGTTTKKRRDEIAKMANKGEIKVVVGSTQTLGTGVNIQENLRAMHHIDAPYMPGDLEQRNGRGHRQGNKFNTVLEYRYVTAGIDGRRWQILLVKDRFIKMFLKLKDGGLQRTIDGDAVEVDESGGVSDLTSTLGAAAGDPRIMVRAKLENSIRDLQEQRRQFENNKFTAAQDARRHSEYLGRIKGRLPAMSAYVARHKDSIGKPFCMVIDGVAYDSRTHAEGMLAAKASAVREDTAVPLAEYRGSTLMVSRKYGMTRVFVEGFQYDADADTVSLSAVDGLMTRLKNWVEQLVEKGIADKEKSVASLEAAANATFRNGGLLARKEKDLKDLLGDLSEYPAPPPEWLTEGAPSGTAVYIGGTEHTVGGHRWGKDDYYIKAVNENGNGTWVSYKSAADENGQRIYAEHEFEAPALTADTGGKDKPGTKEDGGTRFRQPESGKVKAPDIRFRTAGATDELANISRVRDGAPPKNTVTAYKLFRVAAHRPGELFPLFVLSGKAIRMGVWLDAEEGERKGNGVKSKLGQLAYRPGWHAGDLPVATHIGEKANPQDTKPSYRHPHTVWAEIEMAADVDWQAEADRRARRTKDGQAVASTAHITDGIPKDGYYRYKTNPNMTGEWLIGGAMKVNRLLSDNEVKAINGKAGVADLPRRTPFNGEDFGFENPGIRFRQPDHKDDKNAQRVLRESAARYAFASDMPVEGERLVTRQLEFVFSNQDVFARAFGDMDNPKAWKRALDAGEGTVSRVLHDFFAEGTGHTFPRTFKGRPLAGLKIESHRDVAALMMPLRNPYQESMKAVFLDKDNRVLDAQVVTVGLLNNSLTHPREVFKRGLVIGAKSVILAHNHPSGDPTPSKQDREITDRLKKAGDILGIECVDHVITNGKSYHSLTEGATLPFDGETPEWEAYEAGKTLRIVSPVEASRFVGVLRQDAGKCIHVIALDTKRHITAVSRIPFDPAQLDDGAYVRGGIVGKAFRAAAAHPSASVILDLAADGITPAKAKQIHKAAQAVEETIGIPVSDSIYNSDGWARSVKDGDGYGPLIPLTAQAAEARNTADGGKGNGIRFRQPGEGRDRPRLGTVIGNLAVAEKVRWVDNLHWGEKLFKESMARLTKEQRKYFEKNEDWLSLTRKIASLHFNEARQMEDTFVKPMVDALRDGGWTLEDLHEYAQARHAPYFNKMIALRRESGMAAGALRQSIINSGLFKGDVPAEFADTLLNGLNDGWAGVGLSDENAARTVADYQSGAGFRHLQEAHDLLVAMNQAMLKRRVKAGLMSEREEEVLRTLSPVYVPLHVMEQDGEMPAPAGMSGNSIGAKEFRHAKGHRGQENVDVVAQSVMQAYTGIRRSLENEARLELLKLLRLSDDTGRYGISDNPPLRMETARDAMGGLMVVEVRDRQYGLDPRRKSTSRVLIVKEKGRKVYITFKGADAERTVHSLKRDQLYNAKWATFMNNWVNPYLRSVRTTLNPMFLPINVSADFIDAITNVSADGLKSVRDAIPGNIPGAWKAIWAWDNGRGGFPATRHGRHLREAIANGLSFESKYLDKADDVQTELMGRYRRMTQKPGALAMLKPVTDKDTAGLPYLLYTIDRFNNVGELGTRLAVYIAAREKGRMTVKDAVELARNATVDFHKKGNLTPALKALYLFSNSGVQGTYRMGRALVATREGRKAAASIVALGFLCALLNKMLDGGGDGDDTYGDVEEWVKERGALFKSPLTGKWVSLRMRGIPAFLWYAGTKMADVATGSDTMLEAPLRTASMFASSVLNPLGDSGSGLQLLAPTILDPIVQQAENKDWTGRPIVPDAPHDKHKPQSARHYRSVPGAYKKAASALNAMSGGDRRNSGAIDVSPELIRHWVDFLGGGTLKFMALSFSNAAKVAGGEDVEVNQIPFARSFVFDTNDPSIQDRRYYGYVSQFGAAEHMYSTAATPEVRTKALENNPFLQNRNAINKLMQEVHETRKKEDTAKDPQVKKQFAEKRRKLQNRVVELIRQR